MDDRIALNQLAEGRVPAPKQQKLPAPAGYDFEHFGTVLADSLAQSAEDLLAEAQHIAQDARELAAEIRSQVIDQSKAMADINRRLKAAGEQMLEASRKFNGT